MGKLRGKVAVITGLTIYLAQSSREQRLKLAAHLRKHGQPSLASH